MVLASEITHFLSFSICLFKKQQQTLGYTRLVFITHDADVDYTCSIQTVEAMSSIR